MYYKLLSVLQNAQLIWPDLPSVALNRAKWGQETTPPCGGISAISSLKSADSSFHMPIADFVKKVQERKYHLDDRQRALDGSRAESHIVSVTVFVR